jgi:hypothetical protein
MASQLYLNSHLEELQTGSGKVENGLFTCCWIKKSGITLAINSVIAVDCNNRCPVFGKVDQISIENEDVIIRVSYLHHTNIFCTL